MKKRVLVGIYSFDHVGGAEMYTYDLLNALAKRDDIDVEFFAIKEGKLSERVKQELGILPMTGNRYDLILATHNVTVDALHDKGLTIQICHGAILDLELPSLYADYHVGITREVCQSLSAKGFPNSLVLNGLDVKKKKPVKKVNHELQNVLSLCQSEEANDLLQQACDKQKLNFTYFNKHKNPRFDIEQEINKADLVVGIGRSIFDAMACGRPCIVFDSRDYNGNRADGYLKPDLFDEFIQSNCSGRYRNLSFTADDLLKEFEKYDPRDGDKLREIAVERLNVERTAQQLLQMPGNITWKTNVKKNERIFRRRFKRFRKSFKQKLKNIFL